MNTPSTPRRRRAALVLLVLAAIAIAFLVWRLRAAPELEPVELARPQPATAEPRALDVASPATGRAPRSTIEDAPSSSADDPRSAAVAADPIARDPVDVLVVDKATGTPVAGAEVRWANLSELGPMFDLARPRWKSDTSTALASARRTTTDEHGVARVDSRVFPGHVLATHGDRFGRAFADLGLPPPVRVEIARDVGLTIQVVDASGAPVAGVPVCLCVTPDLMTQELWEGTTEGPDGLARVHAITSIKGYAAAPSPSFACLEILSLEPVCVPVDLAKSPADPVRIVLPPCGSVVVAMRDAKGAPATAQTVVIGHEKLVGKDGSLRSGPRSFLPESIAKGDALFPFVGLGVDVHVTAVGAGAKVELEGAGPKTAGEVVRFEAALGEASPALLGRLVTETGEPLRDALAQFALRLKSEANPKGVSSIPQWTDASGRFRLSCPVLTGKPASIVLRIDPIGVGLGEGGAAWREIAFDSVPSEHELGDVVVRMPRVVVSGDVVDDVGAPVAGASLTVECSRPDLESGAWRIDPLVRPARRADSRFEVEALVDVARLRLRANRPGYAESAVVEVEPGTRDLRIVLPRACEIAGRALLDAGIDRKSLSVRALVSGAPLPTERLPKGREAPISADGAFRLTPLPPGKYDVDFRSGPTGEPFLRIAGVEVAPAGKSVDARLDAIDLRGKVPVSAPR